MPDRLPYAWRISRYEPEMRAPGTPFESWTEITDVGRRFNGIALTMEEYLRVENLYVDAAVRIAVEAGAGHFRVVEINLQEAGYALQEGQVLVRSDLAPVVRGNLRAHLACGLFSTDGACYILFGFDFYMYAGATTPCEHAITEIERSGLYVERGVDYFDDIDDDDDDDESRR